MRRILALMSVTALMVVALAVPATAAPLVDVTLTDVIDANGNNVVVQVPISVAANVCDVNVAVLLAAIEDDGDTNCEATSTAVADAPSQRGGGNR